MTRFLNFQLDASSPAPGPFDITYKLFSGDTGFFLNTGTNTALANVSKTNFIAGITGKLSGILGEYVQSIIVKNNQVDCGNTVEYYIPFLAILLDFSGSTFANPPDSAHNFNFYMSGNGVPIATLPNWAGYPTLLVGMTGFADTNYLQPIFPNSPTIVPFSSQFVNHTGNAAGYSVNKLYYTSSSAVPLTGFVISVYSAVIQGVYGSQVIDYQKTIVNATPAGPYSGISVTPAFNFS